MNIKQFVWRSKEAFIWIIAIITMATMAPDNSHHSLCILDNLGLSFCPGCGLGHSISYLFRGMFVESFQAHPFGIFAIVILIHRICIVFISNFKQLIINH